MRPLKKTNSVFTFPFPIEIFTTINLKYLFTLIYYIISNYSIVNKIH